MQNARDASAGSNTDLCASFEQNQAEIVFRHNGGNFKIGEIAHLIYHGSTKIENAETIGQYGSGFLTTHLLSPEIHVSGQLDDDRSFKFLLKREIGSVNDLSESMEQAWNDFKSSLSGITVTDDLTTKFRYSLEGDACQAVEEGITTLKQCAPFVVVFNREFSSIDIKSPDESISFTVIDREPLGQDGLHQVTVEESENGNRREREYILAQGEKASIAVPLESTGDDTKFLPVGRTPRLFLGFPLVGTEDFGFPAVINSLRFTPTENRDGVYLGQSDNDANRGNQAVIEEACDLLGSLLKFSASSGWHNSYLSANIPNIQTRDWFNSDWLSECLEERLIERFRQTHVVLNEDGEGIAPNDLELPLASTDEAVNSLWDLLDGWQGSRQGLPRRDEAAGWCNAAKSWASILGCDVLSLDEVTDGRKLAAKVQEVSHDPSADNPTYRLSNLQNLLKESVSGTKWLDQLITFLNSNELSDAVREYRIVPSQGRFLRTLPRLHRDLGIHQELKDIASLLEWRIGTELRDTRVTSLSDESGAGDWDSEYITGELIKKLQERAEKNPDDKFGQASVLLFAWIVGQESWDLLRGFPVFAERGNSNSWTVIKLERAAENEVRPLAPVKAWEEDLQPFSELFPQRHTLDNAFFDASPDKDVWEKLDDSGFVRKDTVIRKEVYYNTFLPDEPLTEEDHETSEYVDVTDVAFLTRDDIGIMARVRSSQRLARVFWSFLTEWLIVKDSKGLEIAEALCDCSETHRYYPAEWLAPLKRNRWVPLGGDKRGPVTAQSLADLLRGSGWEPSSIGENPDTVKLLEAIGITRFDLVRAFVSVNDEERQQQDNILTGILDAAAGDINRLSHAHQYIEDLKNDENLPDVLDERRERRRIVHENQSLGKQVEDLVKASIEREGFIVRRKPIGSDFEIEYDVVENDEEVGIEVVGKGRRWLVEVKATRGQEVRMTEKQAQTAKQEADRFLLCVVPVSTGNPSLELDDVRANMKFVENIAPLVAPLCDNLDEFKEFRDDITENNDSGVQLVVDSGVARVSVSSSVWESRGFPIDSLLNQLLR